MKAIEIVTAIYGGYPMDLWLALGIVSTTVGASLWIALGKIDEEN